MACSRRCIGVMLSVMMSQKRVMDGVGMTDLARVPVGDGEYIVAEVDRVDLADSDVVLATSELSKAIPQLPGKLEAGLRSLRPAITELFEALKGSGPESIGLEFGLKVGGETGVILAKGTAEVNFKVVVEWKRSPAETPSDESTDEP